eukprot:scaffold2069_cov254-Pinguiococcus_pyrenoidosus.AAC.18
MSALLRRACPRLPTHSLRTRASCAVASALSRFRNLFCPPLPAPAAPSQCASSSSVLLVPDGSSGSVGGHASADFRVASHRSNCAAAAENAPASKVLSTRPRKVAFRLAIAKYRTTSSRGQVSGSFAAAVAPLAASPLTAFDSSCSRMPSPPWRSFFRLSSSCRSVLAEQADRDASTAALARGSQSPSPCVEVLP